MMEMFESGELQQLVGAEPEKKKGRCSWTREPLHRPFVAWNQVDAI